MYPFVFSHKWFMKASQQKVSVKNFVLNNIHVEHYKLFTIYIKFHLYSLSRQMQTWFGPHCVDSVIRASVNNSSTHIVSIFCSWWKPAICRCQWIHVVYSRYFVTPPNKINSCCRGYRRNYIEIAALPFVELFHWL